MTPEQGLIELEKARLSEIAQGWKFVRLLVELVAAYGKAYLWVAADHLNYQPRSLENDLRLGQNPASHYAEELGLSRYHMEQVHGLEQDEAESYLLYAVENGLSARALGHHVRQQLAPRSATSDKEQRMNSIIDLNHKPTETPTAHANVPQDKAYHMQVAPAVAPVLSSHGEDGRQYQYSEFDDNEDYVPFTHRDIDLKDDDTPFDVAERIVEARGVPFAQKVAEEITRWGSWS